MNTKIVPLRKFENAKKIAYGEVYIPNVLDSDNEFMSAEDVEKAAHSFMKNQILSNIDVEHDLLKSGALPVESFIARPGDPDFIPGSWVLGLQFTDELWEKVESGEINGYSLYGVSNVEKIEIEFELPDDGIVSGATFEADGHIHNFKVEFDDNGKFLGGSTDEVDGHSHKIVKGSATSESDGHSHRYLLWDFVINE